MTLKRIDELPDGNAIRVSTAQSAFIQDGITYHSSSAQLPTKTFHARSEAQLIAELGVDLEIPTLEIIKIVIDDDITITKPFKLGDDSLLEIVGGRVGLTLTYTGTGAFFQNIIPGTDDADDLIVRNLTLKGDTTNDVFDVEVSSVLFDIVTMRDFLNLGFIDVSTFKFSSVRTIFNGGAGLVLERPLSVEVRGWSAANFTAQKMTALSLMYNSAPSVAPAILFDDFIGNLEPGDAMLFLDPSFADVAYTITRSRFPFGGGDFYQQANFEAIITVLDNGSGKMRCVSSAHELSDGIVVVLSGFTTSAYNVTARVTIFDANTFDVEAVNFVGGDSGSLEAVSLDQTDPRVTAFKNSNQPDSMHIGEMRSNALIAFPSVIGSFQLIENSPQDVNDFVQDPATERFFVDTFDGEIDYIGNEPITVDINYELLVSKLSGGTDNITIGLFQNGGSHLTKTDQTAIIDVTPQKVIYGGGIFKILPLDRFQLKLNSDAVSTVNVTGLKIVIKRE